MVVSVTLSAVVPVSSVLVSAVFSASLVIVLAAAEGDVTALTVDCHVEQLVCGRYLGGLAGGGGAGQFLLVAELEVFTGVADVVRRQTVLVWTRLLGQECHGCGGGCLPVVSVSGAVVTVVAPAIVVSADTARETDNRSRSCCPEYCTPRRVRCLLAGHY